ncbi:MAG TPA: tetratricopeptide repeat protein [Acidobacteriota bacterium]|nr:tetratricopeptide repeat protein [Acidobacteriota bacterium]
MKRILESALLIALLTLPAVHFAAASQQAKQPTPQAHQSSHDPETQKAIRLAIDGLYEEASRSLRRLLRQRPKDPLLLYYLGVCYHKMDRNGLALEYLRQAVDEEAPFPQAYLWLARSYLRHEEPGSARAALDQGLSLFPRNEDLLEMQARLGCATPNCR